MDMENHSPKIKHILIALAISLILCIGITLIFWLAEKKNVAASNDIINQAERVECSVYYG